MSFDHFIATMLDQFMGMITLLIVVGAIMLVLYMFDEG